MLDDIRQIADKLLIRLLLGFIALAFIVWGIKDVMQSRNDFNIVTFSKIPNITESEFLRAKSDEITTLQSQYHTTLTEEDIKKLGLDQTILKKLINNRILNYLVDYYQLGVSDELMIKLMKESPKFKNDKGEFDINIFRAMLRNNRVSEEEYINKSKEEVLINEFVSTFVGAFKTPEVIIRNTINYMSERRDFDLVQIDLKYFDSKATLPTPDEVQLEELYKNNNELFRIPEKRTLSYIKIASNLLQNKISITNDELLTFYNENKEEFANQTFDKVKKQIKEKLSTQKIDNLIIELLQNLEDDVAAGLRLKEIADKYSFVIEKAENKSQKDILNDKVLSTIAESIFELTDGEVSYPTELKDKTGIVLVEVNSITPSVVPRLQEIRDKVIALWHTQHLINVNLDKLKQFSQEYSANKLDAKELKSRGIKVQYNHSLVRESLQSNNTLPEGLLLSIFQTKIGHSTPVFTMGEVACFAYLKASTIDTKTANKIQKDHTGNISTMIRNSILEELINYQIKQHNMKISQVFNN